MRTIYQAREFIRSQFGKEVTIKVMGIRNKTDYMQGTISECYKNVFILSTEKGKKSFTYTDVLVGNIRVKIK